MATGPCPNCRQPMTVVRGQPIVCEHCGTEFEIVRRDGRARLQRVVPTPASTAMPSSIKLTTTTLALVVGGVVLVVCVLLAATALIAYSLGRNAAQGEQIAPTEPIAAFASATPLPASPLPVTSTPEPTAASTVTWAPTQGPTRTPAPTHTPRPTRTPAPPTDPPVGSRENPIGTDYMLSLSTWGSIGIYDVERPANTTIANENMFNDPPSPGNEYVMLYIYAECSRSGQKCDGWDFGYDLVGGTGSVYEQEFQVVPSPFEGEAYAGGTISGNLLFEVPRNEKDLLLRLTLRYDGSYDEAFLIVP